MKKLRTFKDLEKMKGKSKLFDRDMKIFLDRLYGAPFEWIANKNKISEQRVEQIYSRTLYRLSWPLINEMVKNAANESWDRLSHKIEQLDDINFKYEKALELFKKFTRIDNISRDFKELIDKAELNTKEYDKIRNDLRNVFQIFDDKLSIINGRLDALDCQVYKKISKTKLPKSLE